MDTRNLLSRRTAIKGTIAIAAMASLPAAASEWSGIQRIEKAADEMANAMRAHHGDQFDAIVSPDGTLWLKGRTAPSGDDRLHQLIGEWREQFDAVTTAAASRGEIHMDRLWAIEREAAAIRPLTLEGLAIKLLLLTNYGEFDLDDFRSGLLSEAEAISGYAPPATFRRS